MATIRRILHLITFSLAMIASLSPCHSLDISTENKDSSADKTEQQASAFAASPSSFDEISKFMERSGNLFFGQQPVQANAASPQNVNQAQMLPYFPQAGSQVYRDYTAQGNTNGAVAQPAAARAQIPNYVNVAQRAPLLAQGNVASSNIQQDNNMHQQPLGGSVQRAGNYGGYLQEEDYAPKTEHKSEYVYPAYHKEIVKVPQVGVGINIDPFRFIRALLRAIPRPLLNLNGKVFFGVELGNKLGLVPKKEVIIAKPYAAAHGGHY